MKPYVKNNSAIRMMFEEGNRLRAIYGPENVFDFSLGNPSVPAPDCVRQAIIDLVNEEEPTVLHGYMSNAGFEDVRQTIAESLNRRFGTSFAAKNLIMTVGAASGLNVAFKTILNPGEEVIVFAPYFLEYGAYVRNYDGNLVEISPDTTTFQPNLKEFEDTHDERVPSKLRDQVSRFGWAKDEFVDNDNFPTQLYVREARRLNGEYIMTQKNCQGEETVGDAIGMAAYGMDSHNCQRIVTNGMVKNEGDVQYHGFPPYPISYKSITPKREECTNLLVPVCISSTHIAFGSIRMEPVFMVLGQSAAVASALAINDNTDVQTIDVTKLRKILKDNPYLDGSTPEILVDDSDIDKIERSGHWQKSFGAHYKNSYLKSANQKNNCSFTFMPVIKKADTYEVFFYCTALPDQEMPEVMAFDITGKEGTKQVEISPRSHKGSWVSLGTYAFEKGNWTSSIKIDGCRSKGALFADAIILVPKK